MSKKYRSGHTIVREETSIDDDWWVRGDSADYHDDGYEITYQRSFFDDDYETTYKKVGAASSRWRDYYSGYGGGFLSKTYSSFSRKDLSQEDRNREFLKTELKQIARTVNAVRNSKGALSREKNLIVAWGSGDISNKEHNNINNSSKIFLSSDPLLIEGIKDDWTLDQKRDSVIGEALTLTAMKRTIQPVHAKKLHQDVFSEIRCETDYNEEQLLVVKPTLLSNESETDIFRTRLIAKKVWESLETFKAQYDLLQDYKGCRDYFNAFLAFHSSKEYGAKLKKYFDVLDGEEIRLSSIQGAEILCWNINHHSFMSEQVIPPDGEVAEILAEAYELLMDGLEERSTIKRWELAVDVARVLKELDKDQDQEPEELALQLNSLLNAQSGTAGRLFGGLVDSATNVGDGIEIEVDNIEPDGFGGMGFSDVSEGAVLTELYGHELAQGIGLEGHQGERKQNHPWIPDLYHYTKNTRLVQYRQEIAPYLRSMRNAVAPYAEHTVLPEYGLRKGKISGRNLWKVPTALPDNDRIFRKDQIQGVTRDVTIALLLDYSGSTNGQIIYAEKAIAVLMNDLCLDYPQIDLRFYSHFSGYKNLIRRYDEIAGLLMYDCAGGTNEGTALGLVGKNVFETAPKQNRKIIFSIGDGYSNTHEIKRSVDVCRAAGIEIYNILISDDLDDAEYAYGKGYVLNTPQIKYDFPPNTSYDEKRKKLGSLQTEAILTSIRPWLVRVFSRSISKAA